jgi:hypothetical protein
MEAITPQNIFKLGHWYNLGDLIVCLPGLQHLYRKHGIKTHIYQKIGLPASSYDRHQYPELNEPEHPVKNNEGQQVSMNIEMFEMVKPLIEYQPYIDGMSVWEGESVTFNSIVTRDSRMIPIPASDLHHWMFFMFPQLSCDLSEKWLELPPNGNVFNDLIVSDHIIVNRTRRFTNPYINYYFLKDHQDKLIFAGTEDERKRFNSDFNLNIPRLNVSNFLELAQAINHCRFFVGNQSFCWHISNSLQHKRILEVCASFPNTLPTGKDGRAFLHQEALEIHFNEFLKETE